MPDSTLNSLDRVNFCGQVDYTAAAARPEHDRRTSPQRHPAGVSIPGWRTVTR